MTDREICRSYREAKHGSRQIQVLAELNCVEGMDIIKILLANGEMLPSGVIRGIYRRLDILDKQIAEKEHEYRETAGLINGCGIKR